MKKTFLNLFAYLKNPVLGKDTNTELKYRFKVFFKIFKISILTSFILTPIFVIIGEIGWVDLDKHGMEELIQKLSKLHLAFFVVILAPIIEELVFRAPLTLFKNPKLFKIAFYTLTLLFGFVHISNFEITKNMLFLSPLLVLPQTLLGGYLGYIRVRFGLQWSVLLHGTYNFFFLLIIFISEY